MSRPFAPVAYAILNRYGLLLMSLDFLPADAGPGFAVGAAKPWTGRYPVSSGLFEVRPARMPRDVLPVFDDDLDCIVGYQRAFADRCHLFDLNGDMLGVWEAMTALPPPAERGSLMVVGGLWKANVRGMTALGLNGSGMALAPAMLAQLRSRFAALADTPLLYAEAAHARMSDPQRFVPVHILRLAMRHGERIAPPEGLKGVARYMIGLRIRQLPFMLDLVTAHAGATIVAFNYWRYADTSPVARSRGNP